MGDKDNNDAGPIPRTAEESRDRDATRDRNVEKALDGTGRYSTGPAPNIQIARPRWSGDKAPTTYADAAKTRLADKNQPREVE